MFDLLGPLDELVIKGCDLHIFLAAFLDHLNGTLFEYPIVFPQIKELKILTPRMDIYETECMDALVDLAESQDVLGRPFERMVIRASFLPAGIADRLGRWVGEVDCRWELG